MYYGVDLFWDELRFGLELFERPLVEWVGFEKVVDVVVVAVAAEDVAVVENIVAVEML